MNFTTIFITLIIGVILLGAFDMWIDYKKDKDEKDRKIKND